MSTLLLLSHAIAGFALAALLTHDLLWSLPYLRQRDARRVAEARFGRWAWRMFLVTMVLGLLLYPDYKLNVRLAWIDLHRPEVGRLFDVKEHWMAITAPVLCAQRYLGRTLALGSCTNPWAAYVYVGCTAACATTVWGAIVIGLYTVAVRSVVSL